MAECAVGVSLKFFLLQEAYLESSHVCLAVSERNLKILLRLGRKGSEEIDLGNPRATVAR